MTDETSDWQQVMRACDRWLGSRQPIAAGDRLRAAADALAAGDWPDHYGDGELVTAFEDRVGRLLGTEAAAVFPSGTMAQQIALRIHCETRGADTIAADDLPYPSAPALDLYAEAHAREEVRLFAS